MAERTTILVVDDTEANRFVVTRILEEAGFHVLEGGTGSDALRLAPRADLVILDVRMPAPDGFEVVTRLRADPQTTILPVVMLSASFTSDDALARGLDLGADAYLTHPVEPPVLVATVRAVLRARRTERALRESERRFRTLANVVPGIVWIADAAGAMTFASEQWYRYTGLSPAESASRWLELALHPDDRANAAALLPRETHADAPRELEARLRRHDGEYRWFLTRATPVCGEEGRAVAWFGITTDIHDRRRSEEGQRFLAEASRVLASSLDVNETLAAVARLAVPVLGHFAFAYLVDEHGALRPVGMATTIAEKESLLARMLERLPQAMHGERHPLARALREGRALLFADDSPGTWAHRASDDPAYRELIGALAPTSVMTLPLVARGRTVGALLLGHDAPGARHDASDLALAGELAHRAATAVDNARLYAEAERARRTAEEANRSKSEFLATMSHELRTPLNAIAGYTELLELGIRGPVTAEQREDLLRIRRSQQHLLALINNVLNFARIEAGHLDYRVRALPVVELLDELDPLIEPQLRAKGLDYERVPCPPEIAVRADGEKARQILLNLLSNAVKFTPAGGRVTVACAADDASVRIAVRDTGRGIPPEQAEAIFEPFVQVDRSLSRESDGIGLGLSISRNLARGMGGELGAEPARVGAVFTLTLPRARPGPPT